MSQILLKLWLVGNRTSCRPIGSVIILVIEQIDFVNHSYDYRPNWTPLNPVTTTNRIVSFHYVFYFNIVIIYYSARELYTS